MNLSNLPFPCLTNISNFLPDRDKVTLTILNKNLRDFSEHTYLDTPKYEHLISPFHSKYPIWDPTRPMPNTNSIVINTRHIPNTNIYPQIIELEISNLSEPNLDMFPNLQYLHIMNLCTKATLPVTLKRILIDSAYGDCSITNLNELINLETIYIIDSRDDFDIDLNNHPKLYSLISYTRINLICNKIYPNIRTFKTLGHSSNISPSIFEDSFPNLVELGYYDGYPVDIIYQLDKLTSLECISSVPMDLSRFPRLKVFKGEECLIPEQGLPNIRKLEASNVQYDITEDLLPNLEFCKISNLGNDKKFVIDHDGLKSLIIHHTNKCSIRGSKLRSIDIYGGNSSNMEFVGKFEYLKTLEIRGDNSNKNGYMDIDFDKFIALEEFDAIGSYLGISGACKTLKSLKVAGFQGETDLSGFVRLEYIMMSGRLNDMLILGPNMKKICFGNPSLDDDDDEYDFGRDRRVSMRYLDMSRCKEYVIIDDMGYHATFNRIDAWLLG